MSKAVFILGIVLIGIGVVGFVAGIVGISSTVANTVSAVNNPDASKLCNPGESLATEEGPQEYDVTQHLYDSSIDFYCVNGAGVRRDVTDQVGKGAIEGILGSFGSVLIPFASCGVFVIGVLLAVFAGIFLQRRVIRSVIGGQGMMAGFAPVMQAPASPVGDDLALKLRQLDEARQANLVSEDEYQRKRQQLLDAMP